MTTSSERSQATTPVRVPTSDPETACRIANVAAALERDRGPYPSWLAREAARRAAESGGRPA